MAKKARRTAKQRAADKKNGARLKAWNKKHPHGRKGKKSHKGRCK